MQFWGFNENNFKKKIFIFAFGQNNGTFRHGCIFILLNKVILIKVGGFYA